MHLISTVPGSTSSWVEIWYGDDRIGPPTPLVTFQQSIQHNDAMERVVVKNTVTLRGKFIDSPSGTYNALETAQDNLRSIFSIDKKELAFRAGPANTKLAPGEYLSSGVYPRVTSINIPEDIQVKLFDYEVVLEYETTPTSGVTGSIESYADSWDWSENAEELTVDITHNVNAKGFNTATSGSASNAHTNARTFVTNRLGLANSPAGFPVHVHQSQALLHEITSRRTESVGLSDGTYTATEFFKVSSGIYPWNHSQRGSVNTDGALVRTVELTGKVQGFGRTNLAASGNIGFDNAVSGWQNQVEPSLYYDATQSYANFGGTNTLNTKASARSVTQNPFLGLVEYSITFDDNPARNLPSGIAERTLTINRTDPIDTLARFPIPFRRLGAVIQSLGTPTDGRITITASARADNTGDAEADVNRAIARVETDINNNKPDPNSSEFVTLELADSPQMTYDPRALTANATVNWVFTLDRASIKTPSGTLNFTRYSAGA